MNSCKKLQKIHSKAPNIRGFVFIVRFSVIFERSEEIKKTTCYAGGGELALASSRKPPMI
jgi:hypothetical protein